MPENRTGADLSKPVHPEETPAERRRRQRREYHARRTDAYAGGPDSGQPWSVTDARIALDTKLRVPDAAAKVGRTANAVESLRRRWRLGRLPAGLADHIPDPPPTASSAPTTKPEK